MGAIDHDNLEEFQNPYLYDLEEDYYAPDGPFIEALARETGGPLLDLACGTGRLAIPYAEQGFAVTGVDLALPMIEQARRKAAAAGVNVRFVHDDARTVRLGEQFGLIYMTGNAFQAFLTRADQDALLATVVAHLRDDGLWVFGTRSPVPAHLDTDHEETVWNRYTAPDGREITVSGYQRFDPARQLQHWTTIRRCRDASGEPAEWTTRITLRYQTATELVALLHANGLAVRDSYGSWDGELLTPDSEDMRFVCTKA
jgi:SAM-dependent methyltransferase